MTLLRALLAIFMLSALPARAAAPADFLAPDSEARWVAFDLTTGNQIRFRTLLNGRWIDAILDTGVTDTAVSTRFARAAGMKPLVRARADAIGGGIGLSWAALDRVEVGGLVRIGGRIAIIDVDPRATGGGQVDLFVGSDLLAGHALDIDYVARRFRLLPSGRMPVRGTVLPLRLAGPTGLYLTELTLGQQRHRAMIVDLGDGGMVTLTRAAWHGSRVETGPLTTSLAFGMGGQVETELTILPLLPITAPATREVELRIEPDTGFSARKGAAGRIGGGLLRRYRVLLDPRAGRMVIAPHADVQPPVGRSTSGLIVAQDDRRLKVLHVMRGSPAAAAGWNAGMTICAVDGSAIPIGYATSAIAGWSVGAPGRIVRLQLCDGGERAIRLTRFY